MSVTDFWVHPTTVRWMQPEPILRKHVLYKIYIEREREKAKGRIPGIGDEHAAESIYAVVGNDVPRERSCEVLPH